MSAVRRPVLLLAVAALAACTTAGDAGETQPRIVRPGAPGEESEDLDERSAVAGFEHTGTDVRFVQEMIVHHTQVLRATPLVPDRTSRDDVPRFAERLDLTQRDHVELMERWLRARGEEVPDPGDGHESTDEPPPGMLTADALAQLESASGAEFDRLFLERVHDHHVRALRMAEDLHEADGAGEEPDLLHLLNQLRSDQRIELSRIESMLADLDAEE